MKQLRLESLNIRLPQLADAKPSLELSTIPLTIKPLPLLTLLTKLQWITSLISVNLLSKVKSTSKEASPKRLKTLLKLETPKMPRLRV